jgi:hypothetical protein
MITDLARFYICYRGKYLMNFYASRLKNYCSVPEIYKFLCGRYRQKSAFFDFLWLFVTPKFHQECICLTWNFYCKCISWFCINEKNELKRMNHWWVNQYYLVHDKIVICFCILCTCTSHVDYASPGDLIRAVDPTGNKRSDPISDCSGIRRIPNKNRSEPNRVSPDS